MSECLSLTGNGYDGEQQSLRRRQVSSPAPDQSYPHFNWDSTPEDEDEDSDGGPKRDIRCIPLPMHLRRTIRFLNFLLETF